MKDYFIEDEKNKYSKVWKDKEVFPMLSGPNRDEINRVFTKLKIDKVIIFDEEGDVLKENSYFDKLTISILPISSHFNESETMTKYIKENYTLVNYDNLYPLEIDKTLNEKYLSIDKYVYYFESRNLIVILVNPFFSDRLLSLILQTLKDLKVKTLSDKEIYYIKMESIFELKMKKRKADLDSNLKNVDNELITYENNYKELLIRRRKHLKDKEIIDEELKDVSKKTITELEKIKNNPMIKEFKVLDNIYFSFGTIYITAKVITRFEEKDGVKTPIIENKNIEIGPITFIITNNSVRVTNPRKVNNYEHPHASSGSLCLGELSTKITNELISYNISNLIPLLYSWVISYNPDDAYCKIQTFYDKRELERKELELKKEESLK